MSTSREVKNLERDQREDLETERINKKRKHSLRKTSYEHHPDEKFRIFQAMKLEPIDLSSVSLKGNGSSKSLLKKNFFGKTPISVFTRFMDEDMYKWLRPKVFYFIRDRLKRSEQHLFSNDLSKFSIFVCQKYLIPRK